MRRPLNPLAASLVRLASIVEWDGTALSDPSDLDRADQAARKEIARHLVDWGRQQEDADSIAMLICNGFRYQYHKDEP